MKQFVIYVNDRMVQFGVAAYNRIFGKKNIDKGINYAVVEGDDPDKTLTSWCEKKRLNKAFFLIREKKPSDKMPVPMQESRIVEAQQTRDSLLGESCCGMDEGKGGPLYVVWKKKGDDNQFKRMRTFKNKKNAEDYAAGDKTLSVQVVTMPTRADWSLVQDMDEDVSAPLRRVIGEEDGGAGVSRVMSDLVSTVKRMEEYAKDAGDTEEVYNFVSQFATLANWVNGILMSQASFRQRGDEAGMTKSVTKVNKDKLERCFNVLRDAVGKLIKVK